MNTWHILQLWGTTKAKVGEGPIRTNSQDISFLLVLTKIT